MRVAKSEPPNKLLALPVEAVLEVHVEGREVVCKRARRRKVRAGNHQGPFGHSDVGAVDVGLKREVGTVESAGPAAKQVLDAVARLSVEHGGFVARIGVPL